MVRPTADPSSHFELGHFRAGYDLIVASRDIFEVDASGLTSPLLSRFVFKELPRPVYPLDPETEWTQ